MAKKYKVLLGGKDLAECPVTQNDTGKYYWNGKYYYTPVMSKFNSTKLPSGYKAYYNGSHKKYIGNSKRHPWDISARGGLTIKANFDVKIIAATTADGSWVKANIVGTPYMLAFVHVDNWARIGSIVKAGGTICKIKTMAGSHLHIDEWTGQKVYNLIVHGDFNMSKVSKGKRYEFTNSDKLNVRDVPNGKVVLDQIPENKKVVGLAVSNTVRSGDYNWNLYAGHGWGGWVAENWSKETSRVITDINGKEITASDCSKQEKEILELNKRINTLTKEIEGLREALRASQSKNVDLTGKVEELEGELGETKAELKACEEKYATLMIEKKTLANTNAALVQELNELKGKSCIKQVIDDFFNWLKKVTKK
jgi:regulator of replication initiation timing